MHNYLPLLLMAFLAMPSAQAFGQDKDLLTAEYSKCIEQSGGTDPGMLDCMGAEAERQDKRLNDAYKKLMNELKPERRKELQEAQRCGSSTLRRTAISILIQTEEPQPS